MNEIACLGWGSLVWDPRQLPVRRHWFEDGPILPIEFARESAGQRITLVLVDEARPVRSLWALMSSSSVDKAREALRKRERIPEAYRDRYMGYWCINSKSDGIGVAEVERWAQRVGLDAVVWTALPPKFKGEEKCVPSPEQVVEYIRGLDAEARRNAEVYIRRAPFQIDTDVRRRVELELGWTPISGAEMRR